MTIDIDSRLRGNDNKRYMSKIKIISLGGIGDVTKNMYVYETEKDILVVDCGVGFPDETMLGVDLIIPDISYLEKNKQKIRGLVLTHGHEDHIGALPYLWPALKVPVYATQLTAALAENKMKDAKINCHVNVVSYEQKVSLGDFNVQFVRISHSVPDAANLFISSPAGNFFHASDFKFDWTPLDGKFPEVDKIALAGKTGITCLLSDCLRSEKEGYTLSEKNIESQLEEEIRNCTGKFIVTAHSSDIFRWQLVVNVSRRHNRKIAILGRSVDQAVDISSKLGYLKGLEGLLIDSHKIKHFPPESLCLLISGSQGQPDSALARFANNEHQLTKVTPGDVVVFSADPIPGNENSVHNAIDNLTKLGARVSYSEVTDNLHVSGHAAAEELKLMMALTKPKYLLPIGGTFRQMKKYGELAQEMGWSKQNIILTEPGQPVTFSDGRFSLEKKIELENVLVDGLGVGDVGSVVLRDRQKMSKDGMVMVLVTIEASTGKIVAAPDIISRGFVYMRESADLINQAKKVVLHTLSQHQGKISDWPFVRKKVEISLEEFFYKQTYRRPMILPLVVEV